MKDAKDDIKKHKQFILLTGLRATEKISSDKELQGLHSLKCFSLMVRLAVTYT
jgi:hypothetical protein